MDYTKPTDMVRTMIDSAGNKLALAPRDLLIRGMLSGALLGAATALYLTHRPAEAGKFVPSAARVPAE